MSVLASLQFFSKILFYKHTETITKVFIFIFGAFVITKSEPETCGSDIFNASVHCHKYIIPGGLHAIGSGDYELFKNSIFFIETSCSGGLNFRQACSVEAAARTNPTRNVIVLFAGPVSKGCATIPPLSAFRNYTNIHLYRIYTSKFVKNTPIEELMSNKTLLELGVYPVHERSELLRFTTLLKYGGVYLDLDMMLVRNLNELPQSENFVGKELAADGYRISSAIIGLTEYGLGRAISRKILSTLNQEYRPNDFSYSGNGILYNVLKSVCNTTDIMSMNANVCKGFEVYNREFFSPVTFLNWRTYFHKFNGVFTVEHFGFHLHNSISSKDDEIPEDSLYAYLVRNFCPAVLKETNFNFTVYDSDDEALLFRND